MTNLGAALQNVSRNSTAGAQVLEQMRDRINDRDGRLEDIIHKQGTRSTAMLAVAIFLSISALVAVCVLGYMLMMQKPPVTEFRIPEMHACVMGVSPCVNRQHGRDSVTRA